MKDTFFLPAECADPDILAAEARDLGLSWIPDAFEDHPVIVLVLNKERQIVFGNKAALEVFGFGKDGTVVGFRPGEALGCIQVRETCSGCGTGASCEFCGAAKAIKSAVEGYAASGICTITRDSGNGLEPLDLKVWTKPFVQNGRDYIMLTALDVSDERRREVLENTFYHDTLNTVGGISSLMSLVSECGSEETNSFLGMARNSLVSLIDEIQAQRDFSLAEKGEFGVSFTPFEVQSMIREIIFLFKNMTDDRGLSVTLDCGEMNIFSDRVLIRRIAVNLFKNAIEASPKNGSILIHAEIAGGDFALSVSNEGVMSPESAHRVFSRSFSTKGRGRGIGTWSVKLLAETLLHGKASFVSNEEKGTVFFVTIPVSC